MTLILEGLIGRYGDAILNDKRKPILTAVTHFAF